MKIFHRDVFHKILQPKNISKDKKNAYIKTNPLISLINNIISMLANNNIGMLRMYIMEIITKKLIDQL